MSLLGSCSGVTAGVLTSLGLAVVLDAASMTDLDYDLGRTGGGRLGGNGGTWVVSQDVTKVEMPVMP